MNEVTLFTQHDVVLHAACKRIKEDYEINGIRCRTVKFAAG